MKSFNDYQYPKSKLSDFNCETISQAKREFTHNFYLELEFGLYYSENLFNPSGVAMMKRLTKQGLTEQFQDSGLLIWRKV